MPRFEVMSPSPKRMEGGKVPPAPRLDKLEGKTIGLFWNSKPGGDMALEHIGARLAERYPKATFKKYVGAVGTGARTSASDQDIEKMVSECVAVIASTAD